MWLESNEDRVRCLVSEIFGTPVEKSESGIWEAGVCPMSREEL